MVMLNSGNGDPRMTPERMIEIIRQNGTDVEIKDNIVSFRHDNVPITLIYDTTANRMRLISPIARVEELNETLMMNAMEANFHSTLDARYCISSDVIWSAFIHSLSDLSTMLLRSAIKQVATANVTFGNEYSSGEWTFQG